MLTGILFALGACSVWGLIFVIPSWMSAFSPVEIIFGRYFFYGALSLTIFVKSKKERYPLAIWLKASVFSLATTVIYYLLLILGIRFSNPPVATLIVGLSPICIALYANWKQKEILFRKLVIPSLLMGISLLMINIPELLKSQAPASYLLGLLFSFLTLIVWSWYVVANGRFLKENGQIACGNWATLIGMWSCVWALVLYLITIGLFPDEVHLSKCCTSSDHALHFFIGSLALGGLSSWLGAFLWNKASVLLPISLAGHISLCEVIFGLFYIYLFEHTMPSLFNLMSMALLLFSVLYSIAQFQVKNKTENGQNH